MPKVNVYLPEDLADAVRESGIPVSAVCRRALEQAVRRLATARDALRGPVRDRDLGTHLPCSPPGPAPCCAWPPPVRPPAPPPPRTSRRPWSGCR
ncbi:type II toxin-antitoxin system CcdA family antitoxin [Nocardiopsis sp. CC223A]|uniref:type II toxin-antitoxin system CcdA family antitoxin n=1 Tax=Nocardiopsis sp. CC223A TaxID=3044051 RepID=UPI00278BF845|nr:type II toxin-antitoxin system CcdA family antitoxin [Nocardiopsis sp. CC223A]